jgi:hypothetical protein
LLRGRRRRILPARAAHYGEREQRQREARHTRQGESDRHIRCSPRFPRCSPRFPTIHPARHINPVRGIFWIEAPF